MGYRRGDLAQCHIGFVADQPLLLHRQQARGAVHDAVQADVDQAGTDGDRQPDQDQAMLDAHDQVMGLLVDLDHRRDLLAIGIEQRNVVLDEQLLGWSDELLLGTGLLEVVVAGRDSHLVLEGLLQVFVAFDQLADQGRVAGPDHRTVRGIDIGQQHVGQVSDVVKELATRPAPSVRVDI